MKQLCSILVAALTVTLAVAQPSDGNEIAASCEIRSRMAASSILKDYPVRALGPTAPGGRMVDIAVNPLNPHEFYVALAAGGVFKTTNNGVTFFPVFDEIGSTSIGDMAICPMNPQVLVVGTGEKNSSRSCYSGSGVYRSEDGGKTWESIGLTGTHHIGRVVFHPLDSNTLWVAAIGALYSHNANRGVYKTTDGGKSWRKVLFINDSTGVVDLAVHPGNPDILLAASWERTRRPANFKASGAGSAIFRSDDGGETWEKSSTGFPRGIQVGRTGLSFCQSKPDIVYAVNDSQEEVPNRYKQNKLAREKQVLEELRNMSARQLVDSNDDFLERVLEQFDIQNQYTPTRIRQHISEGLYSPTALAKFFENFHSASTRIQGAQVFRSKDSGMTWEKMNTYDLDGVFHSFGYYFGEIAVSPDDPDLVYLQGIRLLKSRDGGRTWHRLDTLGNPREVHVDHHAMWINPADPDHMLLANDGGLYQSYDEGASWLHLNSIPAGQFYTVNVDMDTPYNIYGGLQDNGVWKGSSEGTYWKQLFSGDGMYVVPDPQDNRIIFTGYHYGNYFRMEMDKRNSVRISPLPDVDGPMLRWNWRSPLIMSRHDGSLYIGANQVFRSTDKGESWAAISSDLTGKQAQGNVSFSTISALAESPLQKGLLYAGTDDGFISVTPDNGRTWRSVHHGLPSGRFVSSIFPSPHEVGTLFVSLNGFRNDDLKTYLFRSDDYGKSWTPVNGNLPEAVANVIVQDPVSRDVLYCGLDNGTYVSLDGGKHWNIFSKLLNTPSYDMLVHPRENELVVATHGRGVYVIDIKPIQRLARMRENAIVAFSLRPVEWSANWGTQKYAWDKAHKPAVDMMFFSSAEGEVLIEIADSAKNVRKSFVHAVHRGFNIVSWDLSLDLAKKKFLPRGSFSIRYGKGKHVDETILTIK